MKVLVSRLNQKLKKEGLTGVLLNVYSKCIQLIDFIIICFFKCMPICNNMIVLESEGDYTDNIRTFYDYLLKNKCNEKYKIIWFVHDPKKYKKEKNVEFVSRFHKGVHFKANYYIAISKFFIFSHPYWLKEWRRAQIVINTSHSVARLKKSSFTKGKIFDYVLCCSPYCQYVKQEGFKIEEANTLLLGMPRIDLMFEHTPCIKKLIENYNNEKVILSMETFKQAKAWKDSDNADSYAINVVHNVESLMKLDTFLKQKDCIMIVKIHHLQDLSFLKTVHLDNIYYINDDVLLESDVQVNQLLENADILLTDYSSVFYEFLLTDRPIGFLIGDIEQYSRGFLMENPLDEMPGEKIKTLEELLVFIVDSLFGKDLFIEKRREIRDKVYTYIDNRNCERLWDWINHH